MTTSTIEREQLFRAIPFRNADMEIRAVDGGDGREFEGIAVPWDVEIDVDGWMWEVWRRGAFNHQLRAANRVKVANRHIMLGGDLVGALKEMRDDAKGLWVRGRISDVTAGNEALTLIRDKALDELSIGFYRVPNGDTVTRDKDGRPHIEMRKADLFEVALEPWGAYGRGARVHDLRRDGRQGGGQQRTVSIVVDGREVASYRLDEPAPPQAEPVKDQQVPPGIAAVDTVLGELPDLSALLPH